VARVVAGDVAKVLPRLAGQTFDLVAIDPPYGQGLAGPTLERLLGLDLLAPDGLIVAEIEAGLDLSARIPATLECLADRTYGQTRICIWMQQNTAWRSTPEPSIP
jgi:16S rRNA (guanine966-N2)-methyltransferase